MFAKQYEVALGCSCFKPLLISIWNFRPFRLTDLQRPYPTSPPPTGSRAGLASGLAMSSSSQKSQEEIIERMKKDFEEMGCTVTVTGGQQAVLTNMTSAQISEAIADNPFMQGVVAQLTGEAPKSKTK